MIEAKDLTPKQAKALRLMNQGWYLMKNGYYWLCCDGIAVRVHNTIFHSFMRHGWITNDPQSIQPERYDLTFWGKQIAEGIQEGSDTDGAQHTAI